MIGIFDSGTGGLSVLRKIRGKNKQENIVYFGDIANMPYGSKHPEILQYLTFRAMRFLRKQGATQIVSACNSVSASVIRPLLDLFVLPSSQITEMVGPTISHFQQKGYSKPVGIIATPATIRSGMYQKEFKNIGIDLQTYAAEHLAAMVEFGATKKQRDDFFRSLIPFLTNHQIKTLILGCTHYPFWEEEFATFFKKNNLEIDLYDPADAVAEKFAIEKVNQKRKTAIFLSQDSQSFRDKVSKILPEGEYTIEIIGQEQHGFDPLPVAL